MFKRHISHPLQGLAGHLFFALIRLLPIAVASGLGGWLGRTFGPGLGLTRRARRNLKHAFPNMTDPEMESIIKDMWDNLGRTVMEYPLLGRIQVYTDIAHVEVIGVEHLDSLRDDKKPGIFIVAGASLVSTEKDWVRLPEEIKEKVTAVGVSIQWDDEAAIGTLLVKVIHA